MAGFLWSGFDKSRLKAHLSMGIERFKLSQNKRANEIKIEKRELANMLRDKSFDKARIRVEGLLRKEQEREAADILALMCELLVARIPLIASEKACPPDLLESIASLMWASKRIGIDELHVVREQLAYKYGDAFAGAAMRGDHVNEKVKSRLSVGVPSDTAKVDALKAIAAEFKVDFVPVRDLTHSEVGLGISSAAVLDSVSGPGTTATVIAGPGGSTTTVLMPAASGGAGGTSASPAPAAPTPTPTPSPEPTHSPVAPVATVLPAGLVFFDPITGAPMTSPPEPHHAALGGGGYPHAGFPGYPYGGPMGGAMPGYPYPYPPQAGLGMGMGGMMMPPGYAPYGYPTPGPLGSVDTLTSKGGSDGGVAPPPYTPAPVMASPGYSYGSSSSASTGTITPASATAAPAPAPAPAPSPSLPRTDAEVRAFASSLIAGSGVTIPEGSTVTVILPKGAGANSTPPSASGGGGGGGATGGAGTRSTGGVLNPEDDAPLPPAPSSSSAADTDPDVPTKSGSGGMAPPAATPAPGTAPSLDDLASRFAKLRAMGDGSQRT